MARVSILCHLRPQVVRVFPSSYYFLSINPHPKVAALQMWVWPALHSHPILSKIVPLPTYPRERRWKWVVLKGDMCWGKSPSLLPSTKISALSDWSFIFLMPKSPISIGSVGHFNYQVLRSAGRDVEGRGGDGIRCVAVQGSEKLFCPQKST